MSATGSSVINTTLPSFAAMDSHHTQSKLSHDTKRSEDHKHKWKLGDWSAVAGGKQRPWHIAPKHLSDQRLGPKARAKLSADQYNTSGATVRKYPLVVLNNEMLAVSHDPSLAPYSSSNSSANSVAHASQAPEPDAGIAYSFDAARGPSDGADILGHALNKAVARFEDQKTTRLVNDEYDIVKADEEGDDFAEMADDFELVGKIEM